MGRYNVVMHDDTIFLQMFLWECFRALVPKTIKYSTIVPSKAGGLGNPRVAKNMLGHASYCELV